MLRFFWNGIKDSATNKLQGAHYSKGPYTTGRDENTITIYASGYEGFSEEVGKAFEIENNSDIQTDYFDKDRIRVAPTHPLYSEVNAAYEKQVIHDNKRIAKREARWAEQRAAK